MKSITKWTLILLTVANLATASAQAAENTGVVNVNTAETEQLTLLPRVGPALAGKIVEHRKENGPFKKTEDLLLVRGIGDKLFAMLEPFVRTSGETTLKVKIKAGALAKEGDAKSAKPDAGRKEAPAANKNTDGAEEGR